MNYLIEEWIDIKKEAPKEIGYYEIKTIHGDFEAPFVRSLSGKMVWVLHDESIISHWRKKQKASCD